MVDNTMGRELGWEDAIEKDSEGFVVLPEGDYDFEIVSFERARHAPAPGQYNTKKTPLPACNKAVLTIDIGSDQASARITHNLYLHTRTEGMLCEFFTSIGARVHGEKVVMDWNKVIGATGRCKVGIRQWIGTKNGKEMQTNEIMRFYEPEPVPVPAPVNAYKTGEF